MKKFLTTFTIFISVLVFSSENESTSHMEKIVLGSGCFWGAEKGYADGEGVRPTYRDITKFSNKFNPNNHAEVVEVTYNKNLITLEELIIHYLESHDPTQLNRQGNDIGTQYRSIVLYSDEAQQSKILELMAEYQTLLREGGYGDIQTIVKPLSQFFVAENFHQDYIKKNPNGYCPDHSTGIKLPGMIMNPRKTIIF